MPTLRAVTLSLPPYSVLMPLAPWEPPGVVAEVLESLRGQSWPADEVVVSCDGVVPSELRRCLLTSGLPIRILEGPGRELVGPVLARGLLHCRHELVVRVDADDLSLRDRCERQVRHMLNDPGLAALSSPIHEFLDDPHHPSGCRTVPVGEARVRSFGRWRNPLNHPAVILRRTKVLAAGNYRARPGFEDYDLWLRLLARGERLDNLPDVTVLARVGPDHLARRRGWRYAAWEIAFLGNCGCEGLLSWPKVLLLLVLRVPLRLAPSRFLLWVMQRLRVGFGQGSGLHRSAKGGRNLQTWMARSSDK